MSAAQATAGAPAAAMRPAASHDVCTFLFHEAQLLNEGRYEDWLALLTEDVFYWVPARHGQQDAENEVSLFADTAAILRNRVERLRHPKLFSQQPPASTLRVIGNIQAGPAPEGGGELVVHSTFTMLEHRRTHAQRTFGGTMEHLLRGGPGSWKIARKTVRLVNCDSTMANLAIPF